MSQAPDPQVMAEAERWFARLQATDCGPSERMEFQRWQATPEHAAAYAATERLWQSLGKLTGRPDLERLSQQVLAETTPSTPRAWQRMAIAASVLISLLIGGAFVAIQNRERPSTVYATKPGELSTVKLADGSQVILNFSTELEARLDKKDRLLWLHKGEAFFTVAHDTHRPFKVVAGNGEVIALGTRFEVRSEAHRVAVTLLEGHIAVDRRQTKEHALLQPGDQVSFTDTTPEMKLRTVDPQVVASWTTGRLLFRSTPLAEALDEVNRYSSTQIRIADPTLVDIPISGTFEVGDGDSVVLALQKLLPVEAISEGDKHVALRRR